MFTPSTFWFQRKLNVLPEAVYCCFTSFYGCIPSFILIGIYVRYRNVLPEAVFTSIVYMFVLSELEVTITSPSFVTLVSNANVFYKNYLVYQIVRSELVVAVTSPSLVTLHPLVSEIAKCIA